MASSTRAASAKRIAIRIAIAVVLLGIAGPLLWTYAALHFAYSTGERVGYVQKLADKGWVCKTKEGELTMQNVAGVPPQIFAFTVRDAKVIDQINGLLGSKVTLTYEQHTGLPSSCFGETEYFVTGAKKAQE